MIKPTIGRVVWYNAGEEQMNSAMVAYVHNDEMVNLAVNDENGVNYPCMDVPLFQGDAEDCPEGSCCWMPYQKKQAEKDTD